MSYHFQNRFSETVWHRQMIYHSCCLSCLLTLLAARRVSLKTSSQKENSFQTRFPSDSCVLGSALSVRRLICVPAGGASGSRPSGSRSNGSCFIRSPSIANGSIGSYSNRRHSIASNLTHSVSMPIQCVPWRTRAN